MTKVYLVGAGPGDAQMLTIKAKQLLSEANFIVYDALVSDEIKLYFSPNAQHIYVGKRKGIHSMKQQEINQLLIDLAHNKGGKIVRLKGGDPFVFGRGGEEIIALKQHKISYEIVPGITSGIAAPAYMGIPITHREISRSVTMITAFTDTGKLLDIDWEALNKVGGTLVFYMGMGSVRTICTSLIEGGFPPHRMACIISNGTLPNEKIIYRSIEDFITDEDFKQYSPGLFVVGDVVAFTKDYQWRQDLPLYGKRIVTTRALNQSSLLVGLLQKYGADTIMLPTIEIIANEDNTLIDCAINKISTYQWVCFTSVNAVKVFFERLYTLGKDIRVCNGVKFAVVGPATHKALRQIGIIADLMPNIFTAEDLCNHLKKYQRKEKKQRILFPTSRLTDATIEQLMTDNGDEVDRIDVYDNRTIKYDPKYLEEILSSKTDYITFCSSSAVIHFFDLLKLYNLHSRIKTLTTIAIGDKTAEALERQGATKIIKPSKPSIEEMVQIIIDNSKK